MVPTVNKNYSILSTVFCSIFFDDFLELLFSPFTKNFASAVNKEIKFFFIRLYDKKKLSNFDEFFSKKIYKIDAKILWKGL